MFSSRFGRLVAENKTAWKAGMAVVAGGVVFKVTYFNFSRRLMVDNMELRHIEATKHLKEAREWGETKSKERDERTPSLTPDQRQQLNQYMQMIQEQEPEVFPESRRR